MAERKIFIYDGNANLVDEGDLSRIEEMQEKVISHNRSSSGEWALIIDESFPPSEYKWKASIKKFVPMTLREKVMSGVETIPETMKVVGASLVPKTLQELVEDGIVAMSPMEKFSDDGEHIVPCTPWEGYKKGVLTIQSLGQRLEAVALQNLAISRNRVINRFPLVSGELSHYKELVVEEWFSLPESERREILESDRRDRFLFLIEECEADRETAAKAFSLITRSANRFLYDRKRLDEAMAALDSQEVRWRSRIESAVEKSDESTLKTIQTELEEAKERLGYLKKRRE